MPDPSPDKHRSESEAASRPAGGELIAQDLHALSRAAAEGDHAALALLHERFAPGLLRLFLKRTRGREDTSEDLAQRCWVLVWESIQRGRYDPNRATLSTFVYAVANNVWLQYLRKAGRSLEVNVATDGPPDFSVASAEDAGNAELIQAVRDAIGSALGSQDPRTAGASSGSGGDAGLTAEERTIVRMMAAGLSDRGVAAQMGLAPSTVNVKKRGALEKIKRFLASKGHRGIE